MKRLLEGTAMRTGVVAAVALAGGLLTSSPAGAATTASGTVATSVTLTAESAALARPRNGTILYDRISGGQGRLKIKNGLSQDGVVALVRGKTKAISIYVRAKSTATINDVRDGTYRIYFTTGTRFNRSKGRFTRNAVYQRFNDKLTYRTTATRIPGWSLTLNPVRGGNAGTSSVNPKDFPA
ncbi:hypothetical protein [Nonomuraea gerenzanensis]|uniref:Uncharacterized protein n=1 Tax=Nonomuraea gerenzanensis TaxID=93944 RepID=A0A1M4E5C9_9ACTN|nr:hypothetical protein [Nonomuraea gerenzanensis]UBU16182.1 hypothetical protein LCN96_14560 [Nonomuraea gerenzanensis]SBO93993.1 hypothetical protein; putative signal peptide [Nonomuraea gerenzanensis]